MKKLLNILIAVVTTAISTFAQDDIYQGGQIDQNTLAVNLSQDANDRLVAKVAADLYGEDCKNCLFPLSKQRTTIVGILNEYNVKAKWGYPTLTEDNLPEFLKLSKIIKGSEINGLVMVYKTTPNNGYSVDPLLPSSDDNFIAFRGMPYIKVKGRNKPETVIVRSEMTPPITQKPAPVIVQAPAPKAPEPVPTATVATTEGSPVFENNIYVECPHGSSGSTTGGYYGGTSGNYNYASRCNDYQNYSYNNWGHGNGVSITFSWGSNDYYWLDDYWYCSKTRQRVQPQIYSSLCNQYRKYQISKQSAGKSTVYQPHKKGYSTSKSYSAPKSYEAPKPKPKPTGQSYVYQNKQKAYGSTKAYGNSKK